MNKDKLNALITLLGDRDDDVSYPAMAEMLRHDASEDGLDGVLAELQESSAPNVRRKSHQMQVIQKIRGKRRRFSGRLGENHPNLLQGLAELHSIWYDEVDYSSLKDLWGLTVSKSAKFKPVTPKRLGRCMRELGFRMYEDNIQDPDLYCLGPVLEDGFGADILLASIALEIGRGFGLRGTVIRANDRFAVLYTSTGQQSNTVKPKILRAISLSSENDWNPKPIDAPTATEVWSTRSALRYVAGILFANAVCSEGPRYIQILASCLAGRKEHESVRDILPYPFGAI
ncbi:MAG: hypothetical protein GXP32_10505 [Kiritimatiellaeota bacterium]|nr:hypothetical protein [Kiritimatiellota bacterium]